MNENNMTSRLGWLSCVLASQRDNLAKIMLRLKGVGLRAGANFSLHRKFMHLMEQVAFERDKEMDIIHEIEKIEKRHRELKQHHMLRCADADAVKNPADQNPRMPAYEEEKPKRSGLLTIFGLLALFSATSIKHKNQDLTVD